MRFLKRLFPYFLAFCAALTLFLFVGNFTIIHGSSMQPVLHAGDIVWVMKVKPYEFFVGKLKQNDIVLLNHDNLYFSKRIAAVPGDTVELYDNSLLINHNKYVPPFALFSRYIDPQPSKALEFRAYLKQESITFTNEANGMYSIKAQHSDYIKMDSLKFIATALAPKNVLRKNRTCSWRKGILENTSNDSSQYYVLSQDLYSGMDSRDFCSISKSAITHKAIFVLFSRNGKNEKNKYSFFQWIK